jgi:serine/threonine protein kinase/tetratricopeptide (TPR) repeat protein
MNDTMSDRNLVFGLLALQMSFVSRDELLDAMQMWAFSKQRSLSELMVEMKLLQPQHRDLLEPLVAAHIQRHDNDPQKSLAAISSVDDVVTSLRKLNDPELNASLRHVPDRRRASESDSGQSSGNDVETVHSPPIDSSEDEPETGHSDRSESMGNTLRYRVIRPHAKGGLGEVFVARDTELNREVALKEIQSQFADELDSRSRFRAEAEITGNLEHPGIVPVYGLGQYADGRPFYAMRFIRGDSLKEAITQFHQRSERSRHASRDEPSTAPGPSIDNTRPKSMLTSDSAHHAERDGYDAADRAVEFRKLLGRFIDVCNAIEYAHSRGVLHRDLKPGNIVLGKYGETLVVDWGLAKALGRTDHTDISMAPVKPSSDSGSAPTMVGSAIGTPAYMSPEQAMGRLDELGPATDVYSLGATLYHVLTGQAPITAQPRRLGAAIAPKPPNLSLAEILRRVQHGEFPRPREIAPHVPKPLEAVCLRAMSLRPEDRYPSASSLAEDIEHWLADELVTAHRETPLATASRWVRKHRAWAMSGAAALALVAVVSSVAGVWINSAQGKVVTAQKAEATQLGIALDNEKLALANQKEAQRLQNLAEQETKRADEEAIRAKVSGELTSFMRELFTSSDPTGLTGSGLLPAGEGSRNVTAVELLDHGAKLMLKKFQSPSRSDQLTRAAMVSAIGDVTRSLGLLEQSKPLLLEALRIRQELLPADNAEIAASQFQLANWHTERGDFQEAEILYAEILAGHLRRGTLDSLEAAEVQLRMSVLFISIGDRRSEQYARDGLATRDRILGDKHRETAIGRVVLAASLMDQEKTAEGIMFGISAMKSLISNHGLENEKTLAAVLEYQAGVGFARVNLQTFAIARFRRAIEITKQSLGPKHLYLSIFLFDLGASLRDNKQLLEAEQVFRECLDVVRNTVGIEHPRAAKLLTAYCEILADLGRPEEGVTLISEALNASEQRYGKAVPWRLRLISVGVISAVNAKKYEMASALGEQALASLETRVQPFSREEGIDLANMAHKLGDLSDITLCRKAYGRVFALNQRQNDLEELWTDNLNFGGILAEHKFYVEAEPYLREAVRLTKTPEVQRIKDYGPMSHTLFCLGKVDWAAGRFAEAEANFRAALAEARKAGTKAKPRDALTRLINFLIVRHQFAEAVPLIAQYGKLADLSPVNRAWNFFLQAALPESPETPEAEKPVLVALEKALGDSTVPDAAMYRARAVVVGQGDAARELVRLDDLLQNDEDREGILMARAACALVLEKPEVALEALNRIKSPLEIDAKSQLRMFFKALADFRRDATDTHRNDLRTAVERAEANLETTRNLTTPEISSYAISNQLELRWWCQQIRREWKSDGN